VGTAAKEAKYAQILATRKACRKCIGIYNPVVIQAGTLDLNHIDPLDRMAREFKCRASWSLGRIGAAISTS
jgi:hypothetical protein